MLQFETVTTHGHKKPSSVGLRVPCGSAPFSFSSAVQYALHSSRITCYKSRPSHSALFHDHTNEYKLGSSSSRYFLYISQQFNVLSLPVIELDSAVVEHVPWSLCYAVFIHVVKALHKKLEGRARLLMDNLQGVSVVTKTRITHSNTRNTVQAYTQFALPPHCSS